MSVALGPFSLERAVRAVERVRERLLRSTGALEKAGIPYAVAGGNAVALWVSRVDEGAVRNTSDVDLLIRRSDLEAVKASLTAVGFVHRKMVGLDMFLDGPAGKPREAVHLLFAGEKVKPEEALANPDVSASVRGEGYQALTLEALALIKLTAFRDKDRTHLRDLLDVGLLDASWEARLPAPLAARLRQLIDTPGG